MVLSKLEIAGEASMSNYVGEVIAGRYLLLEAVGHGGHSVVYRARDQREDIEVAVKMLNPEVARDAEFTARMVREHRAMRALAGTAAVFAHALIVARGGLCLVMELLEGEDLDDHLAGLETRGERLSVGRLLRFLGPVVATLETAHEIGIVHRDLKPGNIFLMVGGGVRLLDFGLAKVSRSRPLTGSGMIVGSPSYIAPEIWLGETADVDHRADIYSLAAIVYRALAGKVPFDSDSILGKMKLATTAPRPSLHERRPDLPRALDAWVAQALAVDPKQRFFNIRGLYNALLEVLGERPEPRPRGNEP